MGSGSSGGDGTSNTTSSASIAPELQPLYSQTGNILSKLQTFQPQKTANPFANFQFPGFQMPSGASAGQPTDTSPPSGIMPTAPASPAGPQQYKNPFTGEIGYSPTTWDPGETPTGEGWTQGPRTIQNIPIEGVPGPSAGVPGATGLPGSVLDEFLFPNPQFIPQATAGQEAILGRQRERAFGEQMTPQEIAAQYGFGTAGQMRPGEQFATGLSSTFPFLRPEEGAAINIGTGFGQMRFPEELALLQANELVGGPIGSSPATQAGMAAVTPRIQNEMEMAGLGRSGALPEALASAYGPIVAQEIAGRQAMVPQFLGLGQALRGGDITQATQLTNIAQAARQGSVQAAQIQAQIANAQRTGDLQGAAQLAKLGDDLVKRESTLLGEASTSEESLRELASMQFQAFTQDQQRRQAIAQSLTTGVLGAFPSVTGQTQVTRSSQKGGGSTILCSFAYRHGYMTEAMWKADGEFGKRLPKDVMIGYRWLASPIVRAMEKWPLIAAFLVPLILLWGKEMQRRVTGIGQGSWFGKTILTLGIPICAFIGGCKNRLVQQPTASFKAIPHRARMNARTFDPSCYSKRFPVKRHLFIPSGISILLLISCPFAVLRKVTFSIVYSFQTSFRGPFAHISEKISKLEPLFTNKDTSLTVIFKTHISRIIASIFHPSPRSVRWSLKVGISGVRIWWYKISSHFASFIGVLVRAVSGRQLIDGSSIIGPKTKQSNKYCSGWLGRLRTKAILGRSWG